MANCIVCGNYSCPPQRPVMFRIIDAGNEMIVTPDFCDNCVPKMASWSCVMRALSGALRTACTPPGADEEKGT